MKTRPRWIVALVLLQFPLHACVSAPRKDVVQPPPASVVLVLPEDGIGLHDLREALTREVTGIASLSPSERETWIREARTLQRYLGGHGAGRAAALRECRAESDEKLSADRAAFCAVLAKQDSRSRRSRKTRRSGAGSPGSLVSRIRQGRLADLQGLGEDELLRALKKAGSFSSLPGLLARVRELPDEDCSKAPLFAALGLKAEEDFPALSARQAAAELDERAFRCASQGGVSGRPAYRLGLLRAWEGDWEGVEDIYSQAMDTPEFSEFRSRMAYWRYVAAGKRADFFAQEQMKALLINEYPLTLHGLLVSPIEPEPHANLDELVPSVALESKDHPELNPLLRFAEALEAEGAREAAVDALASREPDIRRAEGPIQLYAAVLLHRAGDTIHMFHLLTELFKEHSALITPATLAMLYPRSGFDIVSRYSADPYLVLSLIRQESAFNSRAKSPVGALGLMQIMPRTARRMERVSRRTLLDPKVNVRLGIRYFNLLVERYSGDVALALAAYNAGPEKVDEWKDRYPVADRVLFLDLIPFHETREYVAAIARNYYWYQRLYGGEKPREGIVSREPAAQLKPGRANLGRFHLPST